MLTLRNISYTLPNKDLLFEHINLTINRHDKIAIIGKNGSGKSTLLKLISGTLQPDQGRIECLSLPYYIPQVFGQYNHLSIAQALKVQDKLNAMYQILNGIITTENYEQLDDDWTIEERCQEAFDYWELNNLDLSQKMSTLSGGEKTKVFLAGIAIHKPEFILLDEPSNHLDLSGRAHLYDFVTTCNQTLIVVSHDRKLLAQLNTVCELHKNEIQVYGGNYDFYKQQKKIADEALRSDIQDKEKALRRAKEKERETIEKQQKLDAKGKKKQEKSGVARIMMNTLRNSAENSTSKIKRVHTDKTDGISQDLSKLRATLPNVDKMRFEFDNSALHNGKILFRADKINFIYNKEEIWGTDLSFQITSGERIALIGKNGSGKTTLIHLLLDTLQPTTGTLYRAARKIAYVDQDYSLIDDHANVYELTQRFNESLPEHEVKIKLSRFLFDHDSWNKPCSVLSGGERMRLLLCCLSLSDIPPDVIILDEPTNNIDIQNIEILTAAISEYKGTLLVVSHDQTFLDYLGIQRAIML